MSVFLFIALVTLAAFELITLGHPAWLRRFLEAHARLQRYANNGYLAVAFLVVLVILVGWTIFLSFYPPFGFSFFVSEVLFGKLLPRIVLGICFGILFGYLLNSVVLGSPDGKFTNKGKALIALLIVILLLGAGGDQLLQDASRRVSRVSFGGAEVSFISPERTQRARLEGDPFLTGNAFGGSAAVTNDPALPLSIFQALPQMIDRDKRYIDDATNRATGQPADPSLIATLNEAQKFADTMIAPVGRCLEGVAAQTADMDFVKASLSNILPPLRDITWPTHQDDDKFAKDGALAFLNLMRGLFAFAYDHVYTPKFARNPNYHSRQKELEVACQAVVYSLCSMQVWPLTQLAVLQLATNTKPSTRNFIPQDRLARCSDGATNPALEWKLRRYLNQLAQTQGFKTRPYVAIVTATIPAQLGQTDGALIQLENWMEANKARTAPNDQIQSKLLQIRTLNTIAVLTENWIRREGSRASIVLRTFQINRLEEGLKLADDLFDVKTALSHYSHGVSSEKLESLAFSTSPPELGDCSSKTKVSSGPNQQLTLFTWYLTTRATVAHHQLLHPEYAKYYAHLVNATVRELLSTDFGCTVDQATRQQFRADTLRLYGRMQHQDAITMRGMKTRASLENQLRSGISAIDLGLRIIRSDAEKEIKGKTDTSASMPISERLATTEKIETYEALLTARAQLMELLNQLD